MARKYESIWLAIKHAPVGHEVQVKCHATMVTTIKQAVMKEKSTETANRRKLGMRFAGKLVIREAPATPTGYVVIFFKLDWDGTKL